MTPALALGDDQVLIDARPLQSASALRGIGSYVRGLLEGYAELGAAHAMTLLLRDGDPPADVQDMHMRVAQHRLRVVHPTLQPSLDLLLVARALRQERPRLFHAVEWGQPVFAGCPVVVTIHDLIPFVFPRHYPWVRRARVLPLRALHRADRVIAVSTSTAYDVERIAGVDPSRITVVHEGISPAFQPAPTEAVARIRAHLNLGDRRFVLAVGTFDPRKRIRLLADVMHRIAGNEDVDLVIAGDQGTFEARVRNALRDAEVAKRAHLVGHVSLADLIALYTAAECLLFPSAYEGFGLPPLEAMACGAPVIMFDNSSLPEVGGTVAITVRDGDAQAMADAACRLMKDPAERHRLQTAGRERAAGFTWRRSAERTLDVYAQALGH